MPSKGMRSLCFNPKLPSYSSSPQPSSHFSSPSRFSFSPSPLHPSFSETVMDRTLDFAEPIITKWDPQNTTFARVTSLFHENRLEARDFIKTVYNLHRAMQFLVTESSSSDKMVRAQNLMQIAMNRLQKEFYQILSMNRAHLDPESVSTRSSHASVGSSPSDYDDEYDDVTVGSESIYGEDAFTIAMADLRLIAECMISSGYAKECLKIYTIIRKSIVDETIYKLGVEKFTSSQIHKMDSEVLEFRITNWLNALKAAVETLFNGERILCDYVFASSDTIRESCFMEITKEGALILLGFPENVAKNTKKLPEKIFRALDMYAGIVNQWPEIESIFYFDTAINIKTQALTSLIKLGDFIRAALIELESVIRKDSSKIIPGGGGIHYLTIDAMNYLSILADHSNILTEIFADSPPPVKKALPESHFGFSDSDESSSPEISNSIPISNRIAWFISVLLSKLDGKAKLYRDISSSYLFLANNLQYVVVKVKTSNLKYIINDECLRKQEKKLKHFASSYERLGWSHVINSLPSDPTVVASPQKVKEIFKKFNIEFDQAYKKQCVCVVPDNNLRDHIRNSIGEKIYRLYREFYNVHRRTMGRERNLVTMVKYTPEDVGNYLSDLFSVDVESGSFSSFSPTPPPSPCRQLVSVKRNCNSNKSLISSESPSREIALQSRV